MNVAFRLATALDVPAVLELLIDDALGATREGADLALYQDAFARMQSEGENHLIVGEAEGRIVATCQLTFISGLSLHAARRAHVESVRVASDLRGQGIGRQMMDEVERRARGWLRPDPADHEQKPHRFREILPEPRLYAFAHRV